MIPDSMNADQLAKHQDWVEGLLEAGEEVRWFSQPLPSRFVRRGWLVVLIACFWLGAAGLGFWSRLKNLPYGIADPEFPLIAGTFLPLMGLGAYLLTKPLRDVSRALRIFYLVTDDRALVLITGKHPRSYSFFGEQLQGLVVKTESDGTGDILFRDAGHPPKVSQFVGVRQVLAVAELIRGVGKH
jgi:hypothetical protein